MSMKKHLSLLLAALLCLGLLPAGALAAEEGKDVFLVKFVDGAGATLKAEYVEAGGAATAPDDPVREGYVFAGWDPADFGEVTGELTVTAQWRSEDEVALNAVREAIAALPDDPKTLLRQTDDERVVTAAALYNALSEELRSELSDDERLLLAKCAIAVLPSDPFDVTNDHKTPIAAAQAVFDSLPAELQEGLDTDEASSSRSYGRYLENDAWALDALRRVNNYTLLANGTYTGQVESSINWSKNTSPRKLPFTVIVVSRNLSTRIVPLTNISFFANSDLIETLFIISPRIAMPLLPKTSVVAY